MRISNYYKRTSCLCESPNSLHASWSKAQMRNFFLSSHATSKFALSRSVPLDVYGFFNATHMLTHLLIPDWCWIMLRKIRERNAHLLCSERRDTKRRFGSLLLILCYWTSCCDNMVCIIILSPFHAKSWKLLLKWKFTVSLKLYFNWSLILYLLGYTHASFFLHYVFRLHGRIPLL